MRPEDELTDRLVSLDGLEYRSVEAHLDGVDRSWLAESYVQVGTLDLAP